MKENQVEELVADLRQFLDNEDKYRQFDFPYHRGYLFYGPKGTGKTSLIKALAKEFGMSIYFLPLGSTKDSNITSLVSSIPPKSILLLEDIDIFNAATEREEQKDSVNMSTLLNSLDGVYTPDGLITIMTTNHIDKLDEALIRSGRIDYRLELDECDSYQVLSILDSAYDLTKYERNMIQGMDLNITPADLTGLIKTNLNDKLSTLKELQSWSK